jgi:alkylated DNA repair dioxygenase AlkB
MNVSFVLWLIAAVICERKNFARIYSKGETMAGQQDLFVDAIDNSASATPEGFRYRADFVDRQSESELLRLIEKLELKPFEFHGHLGNRRVISFGLRYNYGQREVQKAQDIPLSLSELRARAAEFAGWLAQDVKQVGINEYRAGAGIG